MEDGMTPRERLSGRKPRLVRPRIVKKTVSCKPTKLARRCYRSTTATPTPLNALPFVYRPTRGLKKPTHWLVPENIDYFAACALGREYAAHFIQYLIDNPELVGMSIFGLIVKDIDFQDESDRKGCRVGFFAYLERIIHAQGRRMDVFDDVEQLNSDEMAMMTQMEAAEKK